MIALSLSDLDHAPLQLRLSQELSLSPEAVFAELADPARWTEWFPLMHEARWVSDTVATEGAEREVALYGLGRFRERMLVWEPGARLCFTMLAGTSPLTARMAEDHRLTRTPSGGTRFDYCAAVTPTALGGVLAGGLRVIMSQLVRRAITNLQRVAQSRPAR
jgi:uncharacterized protein YndB with AHSA1/START domain